MDLSHYTKKELVSMINQLEGPEVTMRPRKDTLIEILLDRMPVEPVDIDKYVPEYSMCDGNGAFTRADDAPHITLAKAPEFINRTTQDEHTSLGKIAWICGIVSFIVIMYALFTI